MPYTVLLQGCLLGETEFEQQGPSPRQRMGLFWPTKRGVEMLPALTGFLSTMLRLKQTIEGRGLSPDDMDPDDIADLLENTPAGQGVVEYAKALEALVVRDPRGRRLTFTSIAVSDLRELKRLGDELDVAAARDLPDDDPALRRPTDGQVEPESPYVISATFAAEDRLPSRQRITSPRWRLRS